MVCGLRQYPLRYSGQKQAWRSRFNSGFDPWWLSPGRAGSNPAAQLTAWKDRRAAGAILIRSPAAFFVPS